MAAVDALIGPETRAGLLERAKPLGRVTWLANTLLGSCDVFWNSMLTMR